jgi:DNA-binding MarR family transcriptional regulator
MGNRPVTPVVLETALGFHITRLAILLRRRLTRALRNYDLNPEQWQTLAALVNADRPLNQSELAQLTLKDRHSMSRMLAKLARHGWVTQRPDPSDARGQHVTATAKAREQYPTIAQALLDAFQPLFEQMPKEDREVTLATVRRLTAILSARE